MFWLASAYPITQYFGVTTCISLNQDGFIPFSGVEPLIFRICLMDSSPFGLLTPAAFPFQKKTNTRLHCGRNLWPGGDDLGGLFPMLQPTTGEAVPPMLQVSLGGSSFPSQTGWCFFYHPSEKYGFVNWDDDRNPI